MSTMPFTSGTCWCSMASMPWRSVTSAIPHPWHPPAMRTMTTASCTSISSTRPPCRATMGCTWLSNRSATRSYKASPAGTGSASDDALYERVADLFDSQVNPMVARHGGRVELIDVQDAVVMVRMAGGCQGCGMADVTLRQGIEAMLHQHVPEVKGIVDITDHAAGSNPYFAAAKK